MSASPRLPLSLSLPLPPPLFLFYYQGIGAVSMQFVDLLHQLLLALLSLTQESVGLTKLRLDLGASELMLSVFRAETLDLLDEGVVLLLRLHQPFP